MKKRLINYQYEYSQAIKNASKTDLIVKPEVWIYFKFTQDNNIIPTDKEFYKLILDVKSYDAELFKLLIETHYLIVKQIMNE